MLLLLLFLFFSSVTSNIQGTNNSTRGRPKLNSNAKKDLKIQSRSKKQKVILLEEGQHFAK